MTPRAARPGPRLLLTISGKLPDGSLHSRSWIVPAAAAAAVARMFGVPYLESFVTAEAAEANSDQLAARPGYVEIHPGRVGDAPG